MSVLIRHQLSLALIAVLVFFTNLGGYALFDEDEPKNAVCGREMFERGDWIAPTFNAELRTDKPILIYWLMHVSFRLFGVSEFSARFGSALLAVGTVLLTYHLGRKLYSPSIGWQAGLILATSLMFSAVGRAVTPDATLIFCLMLAFTSYVWVVSARRGGQFSGTDESNAASRWTDLLPSFWPGAIPMYAAMGLAILAKGPIGVLLPCTIIGLFLLVSMRSSEIAAGRLQAPTGAWWQRIPISVAQVMNPEKVFQVGLAMRLLLGAAVVIAVAVPWYVAVGIRTDGAWLQGFLGDHNLGRFLEPKENHSGPIFYYLIVLMMGCFPWSVFLPLALWQLRSRLMKGASCNDSDRLVTCWAGVWLVFFSLARTKLPNYVLPMYPVLALITARYLHDWQWSTSGIGAISFRHCCRVMAAVGVLMIAGIPIALSILMPGEEWLLVIGAVPLVGATLAYVAVLHERRLQAIRIVSVTAVALAVSIVGIAPTRIDTHQDSPRLANAARRVSGLPQPEIAVFDVFSPSLVYYAHHPVEGLREPNDVRTFLLAHPDGFVVTRADRLDQLPGGASSFVEVARCRRFLRPYDMVLLSRQDRVAAVPSDAPRR